MGAPAEHRRFAALSLAVTAIAMVVVVLGAWVRLSDAGLGCPDWPGCYGHLAVPSGPAVTAANEAWPARPVEPVRAWKEMIHRYVAGALGIAIAGLALFAWRRRASLPVVLPSLLVVLVALQALLGMWTVTLLLKPLVVLAHLLGGFGTLALLWWLALRSGAGAAASGGAAAPVAPWLRPFAVVGIVVLVAQIALGGWTSSNYAALACTDFPTCRHTWWPPGMDFAEAFVLWRGVGVDYEGGVLDDAARVAIHVSHRIGALVTTMVLAGLALSAILLRSSRAIMRAGWAIIGLLALQIALGIGNVVLSLPLAVASAHNAVAALLLLSLVYLLHRLYPVTRAAPRALPVARANTDLPQPWPR